MKRRIVCILCALLLLCFGAAAETFTSVQQGFHGDVTTSVTFENGVIASVDVAGDGETVGVGSVAIDELPGKIVKTQSVLVDAVAGATLTSTAILEGVKDCIAQAGLSLADYEVAPEASASAETVRYDADVVIIGAGLSGITAAKSASDAGASVVVLEKLPMTGGSAKSSLGSFMVAEINPESSFIVNGEPDTLEEALARWAKKQEQSVAESVYPDYDRLGYMLGESQNTLEWMTTFGASFTPAGVIADRGMAMLQVDIDGDASATPAGKLLAKFKTLAEENGAVFLTSTPAQSLITEGDAIVGVRAASSEGNVEVYAKAIILACGGYISNQDMLHEYIPALYAITGIGVVGDTGDGMAMATSVGAVPVAPAWIVPCWIAPHPDFVAVNPKAEVFQDSNSPISESESSYYRLVVNRKGERFMNEASQYAAQNLIITYAGENPYYALYDNLSEQVTEIAESGLATGKVFKGETIEAVAEAAGIAPDALKATVERYNALCANGEDADYGKDAKHLVTYGENGPYYLVEMVPSGSDTIGGVVTDYGFHVLREDGSAIDNLYAVGSMSNGAYYNQYYFSGSALTFAATSGRLAGAEAATK